jgi:hypothetical protein
MKKIILFVLVSFFLNTQVSAQIIAGQSAPGISIDTINFYLPVVTNTSLIDNIFPNCDTNHFIKIKTENIYWVTSITHLDNWITIINMDSTIFLGSEMQIPSGPGGTFLSIKMAVSLPSSYTISSSSIINWDNDSLIHLNRLNLGLSGFGVNTYPGYIPMRKKYSNGEYLYGWIHLLNAGNSGVSISEITKFPKLKVIYDTLVCQSNYTFADGFTLNNILQDTVYDFVIPSSTAGCDSLVRTKIHILPYYISHIYDTVCIGTSYTFIDSTTIMNISQDTAYQNIFVMTNGCDSSIVCNIHVLDYKTYDTVQICFGFNFTFPDGTTYNNILSNLNHISQFNSTIGCDSNTITQIYVIQDSSSINIINCNQYFFNNQILTHSGIYYDTLVNANGCDSIITLNLMINYTTSTQNQNSCNSYTFNNQTITQSGIYFDTLINSAGCDSIITLNLTINNSTSNTINQTTCNSYNFNNQTLTQSGTYYDTLLNSTGCDSIITLNLTINNPSSNTINQTTCNSYLFNNQTITQSGTYNDTLINSTGCDSIITLNLTINNPTSNSINQTTCNSYTFNNQTLTTTGIYYDTLINSTGCDSIITLNLTINNPTSNSINQTTCNSYTFNNQALTTSGIYYDILINSTGCDSIITLNLTINNSSVNTINQTACNSFSFNNQALTTSGIYYDTLINSTGCDSIITLNLTINNPNIATSQNGTQLSATATGATYQWLKCNPFAIISGANSQTYAATANGSYAVVVTQNGCSDTSNCMTVNSVGINELNTQNLITISPNPTNSMFTIECPMNGAKVILYNSFGQKLLTSKIENQTSMIDISHYSKGIYIAEIIDDKTSYRVKIIKD